MSEIRQEQTYVSAEELAGSINDNFQAVAERFPAELKTKPAGTTEIICHLGGVGYIAATYLGKVRYGADPLDNFNIRVAMVAEGYDGQLGFNKDYALTYQSYNRDGPVVDRQPATAEDFEGCPAPLEVLNYTVEVLSKEFMDVQSPQRPHLALVENT